MLDARPRCPAGEVQVSEEVGVLRAEVRDLQGDLADARDVMREREKATERALQDMRVSPARARRTRVVDRQNVGHGVTRLKNIISPRVP